MYDKILLNNGPKQNTEMRWGR